MLQVYINISTALFLVSFIDYENKEKEMKTCLPMKTLINTCYTDLCCCY